jgi:hypothetical protein
MNRNVGSFDRLLRALGAIALFTCSAPAPLPLLIRLATFGVIPGSANKTRSPDAS